MTSTRYDNAKIHLERFLEAVEAENTLNLAELVAWRRAFPSVGFYDGRLQQSTVVEGKKTWQDFKP